jgi:hypothetical protein
VIRACAGGSIVEQKNRELFEQKHSRFSHKAGSIVITLAPGLIMEKLRLKASEASPIVWTIAVGFSGHETSLKQAQ